MRITLNTDHFVVTHQYPLLRNILFSHIFDDGRLCDVVQSFMSKFPKHKLGYTGPSLMIRLFHSIIDNSPFLMEYYLQYEHFVLRSI